MQSDLQMRVLNCLQTIIELEDDLGSMDLGKNLVRELKMLKKMVNRVKELEIREDDVLRVERATANFLNELKGPLTLILKKKRKNILIQ